MQTIGVKVSVHGNEHHHDDNYNDININDDDDDDDEATSVFPNVCSFTQFISWKSIQSWLCAKRLDDGKNIWYYL